MSNMSSETSLPFKKNVTPAWSEELRFIISCVNLRRSEANLPNSSFEPIDYTPIYSRYFPDFYLFPNLNKELTGKHHANDNDIISALKDFLHNHKKSSSPVA